MRSNHIVAATAVAVLMGVGATACSSDADVASKNVSKAADNFEVNRRIVVINGITDKYLMVITGACSIDTSDPQKLVAICKTGPAACKSMQKRTSWAKSATRTLRAQILAIFSK